MHKLLDGHLTHIFQSLRGHLWEWGAQCLQRALFSIACAVIRKLSHPVTHDFHEPSDTDLGAPDADMTEKSFISGEKNSPPKAQCGQH